jgi:signal transduction histidine kinase
MKTIFIFFITLLIASAHPQDSRIIEKTDNLKEKVKISSGKDKINAYLELIDYLSLNQPNKALLEKDSILSLAQRLDDKSALITIYLTLGECYSKTSQSEAALEYFEKGLELSKKIKDSSKIADSFIRIGRRKIPFGELDQSLKLFEDALSISTRNKDTHNQILAINYLGILNYILDNIKEAENLSYKALNLAKENNDSEGICLANEHLTIIKIYQKKYNDALNFNKVAYDISLQRDFLVNIPGVYYNFAVIYNRLGDYDKAIDYMYKSEQIRRSFNDKRGIASDLGMLGRIYLSKKDYKNAIDKFKQALEIYKEFDAIRPMTSILSRISTAYENIGDYKSALNYFKEFKTFSDSIYNENVKREAAVSNAKRQLEEKEKEIKYLEEKNEVQIKIQKYLIVFSSLIMILLFSAVVLYLKVRKSRQNLSEINQKLISLNKERDKFFSIISHDLKSPFLGILGITELLKEETSKSDNQQMKKLTENLDKAVNNQYKLVENLLDWTRIQSGKMVYTPEQFILTDVINNALDVLYNFSSQKNIRIEKNIEKDFNVFADKKMITSVLMNLLSNAIKYSYSDSSVNIIVNQKNDDFVSVQIIDNGVGIPQEKISKIFNSDSNLSTEGTEREKGTGLGLLLVKEMLLKNGGDINVKSTVDEGSIFEFTLPSVRN